MSELGPVRQPPAGRRRRPRVPESERKRAVRACVPCRQHKEKCEGGLPCIRCQQFKRVCRFETAQQQWQAEPYHALGSEAPVTVSDKEQQMKRIIRHFLGNNISFEACNLRKIADELEKDSRDAGAHVSSGLESHNLAESYSLEPLSTSTTHYSGEFSHWNFSKMLHRRLQCLDNGTEENDYSETHSGIFRATGLQSSSSCVSSSMVYFPPRPVADFLTDAFLELAQTNYFYFDETTFRQKMDYYYSNERPLTIHDAGWICTLLMTFAVGTQFAYMRTRPSQTSPPSEYIPDDHIGLELYRFSCRLIPDLITIASVETVQAFLLLGVYTLPIDSSGLAYTFYGIAIKMAIQNGMHRKFTGDNLDPETVEIRNRLWWSAYSLESLISILHGRPTSVSRAETDADMPADISSLRLPGQISNLQNISANVFLASQLGELARDILCLRRCQRIQQVGYLHQLMTIRSRLREWWTALPNEIHCRDLSPNGPLFRCNVHLELNYCVATIYMGRPFILTQMNSSPEESTNGSRSDMIKILAEDSVHAALRVIALCQLLHDSVGLARVSYTEFSSCRAALLALIAQSVNKQTGQLRAALSQGMHLIRQMCMGLESAQSEVAVIEALERARQRLDRSNRLEERTAAQSDSGYNQFKRWAELWRIAPPNSNPTATPKDFDGLSGPDQGPLSFDGFFSSFPQELNAFASIPGSGNQLSPNAIWPVELSMPPEISGDSHPT